MSFNSIISDWPGWFGTLLPALWLSIQLTFATLAVGLPFGLLLAVLLQGKSRPLRWLALVIVELGRGTPALVLLYLVYFGLPQANIVFQPFMAATVAFGATTGAYTSEIFRAGLLAVPRGQREAGRAIGLSPWKEYQLVVFPQALRIVIAPILGFSIIVFQGTSLAFVIGMPELLSQAYNIGTVTFKFLSVLVLAAIMYAMIAIPMARLVTIVERRITVRL